MDRWGLGAGCFFDTEHSTLRTQETVQAGRPGQHASERGVPRKGEKGKGEEGKGEEGREGLRVW